MIAVDTNILVHAHRGDSPWHTAAREAVRGLAEGRAPWALPWPCLHEFLAIVTHPRIWKPPSPLDAAWGQVAAWCESPSLVLMAETAGYAAALETTLRESGVVGARVHDARVAALCRHHGIAELWTLDRDFQRFPEVKTHNPLVPHS